MREATGLLPHVNPGVMSAGDLARLRQVSVSAGLMLESAAERLCERGGPHHGCPDKRPAVRLATIRAAGEQSIPFTSGILIGIGETRRERIEALLALRALHAEHGHLQEVIVQNFRAKPGTAMADAPEPALEDHLWTIAVARLVLPPEVSLQAPPNLNPDALDRLLAAGIDDWGGISPVTPDHVNPEAPWPALELLRRATEAAGKALAPRLAIYPRYVLEAERWLAPAMRTAVLQHADAEGYAREDGWVAGAPAEPVAATGGGAAGGELRAILRRARAGETLAEAEVVRLFAARGREALAVCRAADELRQEASGERVAYVVNRNINYTNVCYFGCRFCAFSKGRLAEHLRGPAYDLDLDEIARRTQEAWQRGATEMCLQGGIHPDYTGATYLEICRTVKQAAPAIHVHAFSPLEVWQGARTLGIPLGDFLAELKLRRARLAARHRGRDPRRRGAPGALPGQDHDRAVARGDAHRPCARPAQHRDDHVRPRRPSAPLGAAPAAHPRAAGGNRRLHRAGAAAVRPHGGADLPQGRRAQGADLARGAADARDRTPRAAPARRQHPDLLGQARAARRAGLPAGRRERPRRHADERIDHARGRRRLRPGAAARGDGRADRRARPGGVPTHDALWRSAGRARRGLAVRGAARAARQPPPRRRARARERALVRFG